MNYNIVKVFTIKEFKQILRDISSILIAFFLPLILLFLFGFGINFDTNTVKIGVINEDNTPLSRDIIQSLINSRYLDVSFQKTQNEASKLLSGGKIRGYVTFPNNFSVEYKKNKTAKIQIITDGTEPNTAKFVSSYVKGSIQSYLDYKANEVKNISPKENINPIVRSWYNPALKSTYFVLPGSLAIIMTMTGTVLTALVIAREWERGTMEALLTTEITKEEFVLSKYIAYFILGFLSIVFCLFVIIVFFRVPFYGSYIILLIVSSLFMLNGIGMGLLISTVFKDQFTSSQIAGTVGFMPSMMLSGLIYEIDSMPPFIRALSYIIPAKYYVSAITSLFLSGVVVKTLILNSLYMLLFSFVMYILVLKNTKERIEEC